MPESPTSLDLFAVQAAVDLDTYASPDAFAVEMRRLAQRCAQARTKGALALAAWPENIATFLPLAGHVARVRGVEESSVAMRKVALSMPGRLARTALRYKPRSLEELLFTAVAPQVWRTWWEVFSAIARDYDMWVVAGSALVPRNANGVDTAAFVAADARVYNTSLTFSPTGRCVATTRKVNLVPTQEDVLHLSPGRAVDLDVVDTPFGRLGTVICYDGFDEAHTSDEPGFVPCGRVLDALGADVLVQPSANAWPWEAPWVFNDPGEQKLRSEQWFDEGLARHLQRCRHVRYALNPQLVGTVFDNTFEAPSLLLERSSQGVVVLAQAADPAVEDVVHANVPLPAVVPTLAAVDP